LLDTVGPIFWRKPKLMFSTDHFHPSALGYARAAAVLLPSVSAAVGAVSPRRTR
jgi:lysophospholipase L1-like esterase